MRVRARVDAPPPAGEAEPRRESAVGDSRKNPVLARDDETQSRRARKFFHCQKHRLRVRATRFRAAPASRNGLHCVVRIECAVNENACGASASCDIDNRNPRVSAHCPHRDALASSCCRSARIARARFIASTLP